MAKVKCPRCGEHFGSPYCPQCGIKLDPLKCLLGYCRNRYYEYRSRSRNHKDPALPALEEKWRTYTERLELAIAALDAKEANDNG